MKLTELITSPWAIAPASLTEIQGIYATHLKGDKIDIAAVEARLGRPLANEQQTYTVRDGGIAVLPIEGVLAPKANLFMQISGGQSTQMLGKQIESALADTRVRGIVLAIDSPGGSVFGTPELAAMVAEAARIKPTVAVTDGTMASAAYWVGSAANAVYLSGPTVQAGSIGVVARLQWDAPAPNAMDVTRGRYKRASTNGAAPSADYMAYFEGQLDHLYSVFVDAVATHRGTTADLVLEHMADGRVFVGQQAIDAGLADGFMTVDQAVEAMAANPTQFATRQKAVFATTAQQPAGAQATGTSAEPVPLTTNPHLKAIPMDKATLERDHPALFAQLRTDFGAQAVSEELARQAAVRATALPGHEKLVEALATDGKTTPEQAAMAVLAAERNAQAAAKAAFAADAPQPVPASPAPADQPNAAADKQAVADQATALAKTKGISVLQALKELGHA